MANIKGFIEAVQSKYGMRPLVPFETPIEIGDIGRFAPFGGEVHRGSSIVMPAQQR